MDALHQHQIAAKIIEQVAFYLILSSRGGNRMDKLYFPRVGKHNVNKYKFVSL